MVTARATCAVRGMPATHKRMYLGWKMALPFFEFTLIDDNQTSSQENLPVEERVNVKVLVVRTTDQDVVLSLAGFSRLRRLVIQGKRKLTITEPATLPSLKTIHLPMHDFKAIFSALQMPALRDIRISFSYHQLSDISVTSTQPPVPYRHLYIDTSSLSQDKHIVGMVDATNSTALTLWTDPYLRHSIYAPPKDILLPLLAHPNLTYLKCGFPRRIETWQVREAVRKSKLRVLHMSGNNTDFERDYEDADRTHNLEYMVFLGMLLEIRELRSLTLTYWYCNCLHPFIVHRVMAHPNLMMFDVPKFRGNNGNYDYNGEFDSKPHFLVAINGRAASGPSQRLNRVYKNVFSNGESIAALYDRGGFRRDGDHALTSRVMAFLFSPEDDDSVVDDLFFVLFNPRAGS